MIERVIKENSMAGIDAQLPPVGELGRREDDVRGQGAVHGRGRQSGRDGQHGHGGRGAPAAQSAVDGCAGPGGGHVCGPDALVAEPYLRVVAESGRAAAAAGDVGDRDVEDRCGGCGADGQMLGARGDPQFREHELVAQRHLVGGVRDECAGLADGFGDEQRLVCRPVRRHV